MSNVNENINQKKEHQYRVNNLSSPEEDQAENRQLMVDSTIKDVQKDQNKNQKENDRNIQKEGGFLHNVGEALSNVIDKAKDLLNPIQSEEQIPEVKISEDIPESKPKEKLDQKPKEASNKTDEKYNSDMKKEGTVNQKEKPSFTNDKNLPAEHLKSKPPVNSNVPSEQRENKVEQPDTTGSIKYIVKSISGRDSEKYQNTNRTKPTPNMN